LLIIVFIFKKKSSLFGLQIGDYRFGLKVSALFIGIMLPLIWYFSGSQDFIMQYPHLSLARSDWQIFIVYEIGILLYLFAWEFIWRGFTLFGLYEKFGMHAIFIQMIPFVILHNGKPFVETFGAIAGGIILGYFAVRTKSIYYCIVTHAGVMLMIDLIATLRFRASDYGIGLSSILNIIKEIF
jgi:membrane protease YdiL (CAAX protease family)